VNGNPFGRHEYRNYAQQITEMLQEGRDSYSIKKYLSELEKSLISIPAREKVISKVIEMIYLHQEAIDKGIA
jgi:hypothetical protein